MEVWVFPLNFKPRLSTDGHYLRRNWLFIFFFFEHSCINQAVHILAQMRTTSCYIMQYDQIEGRVSFKMCRTVSPNLR